MWWNSSLCFDFSLHLTGSSSSVMDAVARLWQPWRGHLPSPPPFSPDAEKEDHRAVFVLWGELRRSEGCGAVITLLIDVAGARPCGPQIDEHAGDHPPGRGVADTGLREPGSVLATCMACCRSAGRGRVMELKLLSLRDEARAWWQR